MRSFHKTVILCAIVPALLGGCATTYRRALAPGAADQLDGIPGVVALRQHEIDTSINPSNLTAAAGGGLLFALIDAAANSHSAKKNENFAADLRQALLDYRFEETAVGSLAGRFEAPDRLRLTTVVVAADTTQEDLGTLIQEAEGDAVAIVFSHYLLTPDFTRVVVTADVLICAKTERLYPLAKAETIAKNKVQLLYRNAFQSAWPIPPEFKPAETRGEDVANSWAVKRAEIRREDMVVAWAIDNGRPVRDVLAAACAEIAEMLHWDLTLPAADKYMERGLGRLMVLSYRGPAAVALTGQSLREVDGRKWIRISDGQLYSEPGGTVVAGL